MMPDVNKIMAFENGEMDFDEMVEFFAGLVKSGVAWQLQGSYGRTAAGLIEGGHISRSGEVL